MLCIDQIKQVCKTIVVKDDRKNVNKILKLLNLYGELQTNGDGVIEYEKEMRYLTISLSHVYSKLFSNGWMCVNKDSCIKERQFAGWCRRTYNNFKSKLLGCISSISVENSLSFDAMDVYMKMLEQEAIYFGSGEGVPFFPNMTLKRILISLFNREYCNDVDVISGESRNALWLHFVNNYYKKYLDIQFYIQAELVNSFPNSSCSLVAKWLALCNHDNHYDDDSASLEIFVSNPPSIIENKSKFKSNFEQNWLYILNLQDLSISQYKTILLIIHKRIIPHFQNPTRLMDFLTESYNLDDDVIPILSLNGLFDLMQRFNLEYPNFYTKLYRLLTPNIMHIKYRSRFFRLMDLFLSSTHISSALVASFIKKLSYFSIDASPAAIVTVIPFVYNLIKKHPTCMIMLHNPEFVHEIFTSDKDKNALSKRKAKYKDPFKCDEPNPELTCAIDSSLWELESLTSHYHPNVATLASIFKQPFLKHSYNIEDFLDWSYDSLLAAEATRNLKVLPCLEFQQLGSMFGDYIDCVKW